MSFESYAPEQIRHRCEAITTLERNPLMQRLLRSETTLLTTVGNFYRLHDGLFWEGRASPQLRDYSMGSPPDSRVPTDLIAIIEGMSDTPLTYEDRDREYTTVQEDLKKHRQFEENRSHGDALSFFGGTVGLVMGVASESFITAMIAAAGLIAVPKILGRTKHKENLAQCRGYHACTELIYAARGEDLFLQSYLQHRALQEGIRG